MFINKTNEGLNNICGKQITYFRLQQCLSQRQLAEKLQLLGLDVDKNAIQRIEAGKRFVTDIELTFFSEVFNVSYDILLGTINSSK